MLSPKTPPTLDVMQGALTNLVPLAKAIVALFGPMCEVVIHDLSDPGNLDRTIIALEGNITGRNIGGPPTDYLLEQLRQQKNLSEAEPFAVYPGRTEDGRALKCCTSFIRDGDGRVVGAFCINLDISQWETARDLLERFCSINIVARQEIPDETFAVNVRGTISAIVNDALQAIGKPVAALTKEERIAIVEQLDRRGAFLVRGAIGQIGRVLGVSRYTMYNYLDAIRAQGMVEPQQSPDARRVE